MGTTLKMANELKRGDRFLFTEELGGEPDAEVVTVDSAVTYYGTTEVWCQEVDFTISLIGAQPVEIVEEEEDGA